MGYHRCFLITFLMATLSCGALLADEKGWDYWAGELERGYHAKSQKPFAAFLDAWHADSKPITAETLKKKLPFEQDVYATYAAFFWSEEKTYEDAKFVIIRDQIDVVVVDSDLRDEFVAENLHRHEERIRKLIKTSEFEVKNFRPPLRLEGKKILFLNEQYLAHLVGFITQAKDPFKLLSGNEYPHEKNGSNERQERLQYLNKALTITPDFGGRGWDFITYPIVNRIYLSSTFKRAIIRYRVGSHLHEALLEKEKDSDWMVVLKRLYGII
jgi:hypothetical protein